MNLNLKVPPHNLESEQAILAGILTKPELIKNLILSSIDFYREAHSHLYETMIQMENDGIPIDATTLVAELEKRDLLEKTGGTDYLFSLVEHPSLPHTVPYHENVVKELSMKRDVMMFCSEMGEATTNSTPINDIINNIKAFSHNLTLLSNTTNSLSDEVEDYIKISHGVFLSSDVVRCLQLKERKDQKNVSKILGRCVERGMIERFGTKNGCFRKIEINFKVKDLTKIKKTRLDIRLPLGMEQFAAIKPRNIIMFQGEKDSGKSLLLMECARLNMSRHEVWYFTFEEDEEELLTRVEDHPTLKLEDWRVNWVDDPPNYLDIIQPNAINIIDPIEAKTGQEAYHVPQTIMGIHERLQKGICFVGVQKNKGKDYGVGGQQLLAKPRLTCNVTAINKQISSLKIISCKIRSEEAKRRKIRPAGYRCLFSSPDGIQIIPEGQWEDMSK